MRRLIALIATLAAASCVRSSACGGDERPSPSPSEATGGGSRWTARSSAARCRCSTATRSRWRSSAARSCCRQHGDRVRLHPAVREPRAALRAPSRRRLRRPRLPGRRRRPPGAPRRRRDRRVLRGELRRLVPDVREVERRRRAAEPGVREARRGRRAADLELQQVPARSRRRASSSTGTRGRRPTTPSSPAAIEEQLSAAELRRRDYDGAMRNRSPHSPPSPLPLGLASPAAAPRSRQQTRQLLLADRRFLHRDHPDQAGHRQIRPQTFAFSGEYTICVKGPGGKDCEDFGSSAKRRLRGQGQLAAELPRRARHLQGDLEARGREDRQAARLPRRAQ